MKRIISIVLMVVMILLYPVYAGAEKHDTVTLKNERVLTGKIVSYVPVERVKIKTAAGGEFSFNMEAIDSIAFKNGQAPSSIGNTTWKRLIPNRHLGLRISLDNSLPSKETIESESWNYWSEEYSHEKEEVECKSRVGCSIGVIYQQPIKYGLFFEPGLNIFYNTWSQKHKERINRQSGMRIPLNVGWQHALRPWMKVSAFSGPQLEVGLSWNTAYSNEKGHYGDNQYEGWNRINASWNVGVGFEWWQFYVGVTSSFGMTNIYRSDHYDAHYKVCGRMNTVSVALGYNFNL